ncbi:MAG TPA: beta-N-acetylhexosaminidase, partial [Bryobacteraceae bacterium]
MVRTLTLLALLGSCYSAVAATPPMMPMPAKVGAATGRLAIDGSFQAAATAFSDARLKAALERLTARVARQTGIPIGLGKTPDAGHATLRVEVTAAGPQYPTLGEDESYT